MRLSEFAGVDYGALRTSLSVRQRPDQEKKLPFSIIQSIAKDVGISVPNMDALRQIKNEIDSAGDVFDIDDSTPNTVILKPSNPAPTPTPSAGAGPNIDAMASKNTDLGSPHGSKT
jgi:hypothetical protein